MEIGLMRVEIQLAALAALAAALPVVLTVGFLFRRLVNGTVRATTSLRPVVVSPARQENNACPLERRLRFAVFLQLFCFLSCSCHVRRVVARLARYVECYLWFLNESPSDPFIYYVQQNTRGRLRREWHRLWSGHKASVFSGDFLRFLKVKNIQGQ